MKKKHSIILLILFVSAGSASAASGSFLHGLWNKIFEKDKKSALWKPDGLGTLQKVNKKYQEDLHIHINTVDSDSLNTFFTKLGNLYKKEKSKSKDINNFLCKEAEGLLDKILSFLSLGGKKGLHSEQHCDDLAVCKIAENSCTNDFQNFKKSKCAKMCEKARLATTLPPLISPEEVQNMKTSYEEEIKVSLQLSKEDQKKLMDQITQGCKGVYINSVLPDGWNKMLGDFGLKMIKPDDIATNGPAEDEDTVLTLMVQDDIFAAMVDAQDAASGAKTIEDFKNQYNKEFSKKAVYYANQRKNIQNVQYYVQEMQDKIVPAVQTKYFDQKNSMKIQSNVVSDRATALLQKIGK